MEPDLLFTCDLFGSEMSSEGGAGLWPSQCLGKGLKQAEAEADRDKDQQGIPLPKIYFRRMHANTH